MTRHLLKDGWQVRGLTRNAASKQAQALAASGAEVVQELALASDVQSLAECRAIYCEVMGKNPPRFPLPAWLFKRFGFVGRDLTTMWRWLRTATIDLDTAPTRAIHPDALTVHAWLSRQAETARSA